MKHAARKQLGSEDLSLWQIENHPSILVLRGIAQGTEVLVFRSTARIFTSARKGIMFAVQNGKYGWENELSKRRDEGELASVHTANLGGILQWG